MAAAARRWDPALYAEKYARRHALKVAGGWLIGFGAGEYGGSLWWYADNGVGKRKLLSDNIIGLRSLGPRIALAFAGLAHMGTDAGRALLLSLTADGWAVASSADLGSAPLVSSPADHDRVVVVTNDALLSVSAALQVRRLANVNLSGLHPCSVVVLRAGTIYVGMRLFVLRAVPAEDAYALRWFVPEHCPQFFVDPTKLDCLCLPAR